jgi:hypothetical protein
MLVCHTIKRVFLLNKRGSRIEPSNIFYPCPQKRDQIVILKITCLGSFCTVRNSELNSERFGNFWYKFKTSSDSVWNNPNRPEF